MNNRKNMSSYSAYMEGQLSRKGSPSGNLRVVDELISTAKKLTIVTAKNLHIHFYNHRTFKTVKMDQSFIHKTVLNKIKQVYLKKQGTIQSIKNLIQ